MSPSISAPKTNRDTVEAATPYIRSIVALLIYLREGRAVAYCYNEADQFIRQLKQDMK